MASIEKGTFYLFLSRIVFFLSGYALLFVLGRVILSPSEFGIFGIVLSIVSLLNIVLITGIQQAVSKFVSETPEKAKVILRSALKTQVLFSLCLFLLLFILADYIALLLNEPGIGVYIRITAFVPLLQPFYSTTVGYLNGLKRFKMQSAFFVLYRILRAALPIILALIGFSLIGVFFGLVLASLFAVLAGFALIGFGSKGSYPAKKIFLFSLPIIFYILMQNFFMSIDLLFLKALSPQLDGSLLAGYYTAAQSLARLPFELAVTISLVLFPLVSETVYTANKAKALFYIRNAYRYSFIVVAGCAALIFSTSSELIQLIYGAAYAPGAPPLEILSIAFVFMTIFGVSETIISAKGAPVKAALIALLALIVDIILLYLLIPIQGIEGAANASLVSMFLAALLSTAYVFKHFRRFPFKSIGKTIIACAMVFAVSECFQVSGLALLLEYALLAGVFVLVMLLLRELKSTDIKTVFRMIS
ncbi:MAG: oligosaccharide flippase family protein [Candidatus Diapherotrites archaeon]|nr:oligosaccharide flippase family protein [Candidatus Diapherotrites archaeon]